MKLFGFIFKLFIELIFARKEEYDFKSKHFRPGKVIFAGFVVMILVLNFLLMTALVNYTGKYIDLKEQVDSGALVPANPPVAAPDINQVKGSSDTSKPSAGTP